MSASVYECSELRRASGRQASSVLWSRLFRLEAGGCWEGQDRRSSLPAVCCGWIGDYSSRCVIRSGLYSLGCGPRGSEGEERTVGRACPTGIAFDWCEVNMRDVASSFSWMRPWITPPHSPSCFLTSVCPSCSVPEIQALKSALYAALSNLPIFLKTLILSREALVS